jgi:hypothetical protein
LKELTSITGPIILSVIHHHHNCLESTTKEVGLEVNAEKNMPILMSHYRNAGQNCNIHAANKSFKNVWAKLNNLEMTVIN